MRENNLAMSEEHKAILKTIDRILSAIGTAVLILFLIVTLIYLTVNITNYKTDFLSFNPPDQINKISELELDVPPARPGGPDVIANGNESLGIILSINYVLSYAGTLAEGTPVTLSAQGCIYPQENSSISFVSIGFYGTESNSNTPASFFPKMGEEPIYGSIVPPLLTLGTMSWNTQGNYYPFVNIGFNNGTAPVTINYNDPDHTIYVQPYTVIQNQNSNRIVISGTISGVLLALFISGIAYLGRRLRENPKKENNKQTPKPKPKEKHADQSSKPVKGTTKKGKSKKVNTKQENRSLEDSK